MNPAQHILVFLARAYRAAISPALTALLGPLGFGCRFTPTCSQYAIDAVKAHGAIKGCGLTLGRLCRCQPWGGSGFDPAPPASAERGPSRSAAGAGLGGVEIPLALPDVGALRTRSARGPAGTAGILPANFSQEGACRLEAGGPSGAPPAHSKHQIPLNPAQHGS